LLFAVEGDRAAKDFVCVGTANNSETTEAKLYVRINGNGSN